jgi:class 3 adenylate cyclase
VQAVTGAAAASLYIRDGSNLLLHTAQGPVADVLEGVVIPLDHVCIAAQVARTGVPVMIPDCRDSPNHDRSFDAISGFITRAMLTYPLCGTDGEILGVLQVMNKMGDENKAGQGHPVFETSDQEQFKEFSRIMGYLLSNARLRERLSALTVQQAKMEAYLPKQLVDEIANNCGQKPVLGGKTVLATVLFSDLYGFTSLSEAIGPQQVFHFINTYLQPMADILEGEKAILDKYIGDGIMAVIPSTSDNDDHALRAVRAGVYMQKKLDELRREWAVTSPQWSEVQMRIGINTGPVMMGNVGSDSRMNYTAVGDVVNVAARLEQNSRIGQIYISEATYHGARGMVSAVPLAEPLVVKNRVEPVGVFVVDPLSPDVFLRSV